MPETNIASPIQPCGNKTDPVPVKPDDKHSVTFKVVDDKGNPVEDVVLLIKLPNGAKEEHSTDENGMIEIKGIKPGSCEIISDWHKLTVDNVVLLQ